MKVEGQVDSFPKPSVSDRVYPTTKLAAVVETAAAEGIATQDVLREVGVSPDELHSPDTLISLAQLLQACRNAMRLSHDPHLPFRIGSSIHVSAYGMYGYAILCNVDFRKTMEFCVRYHVLATPLVSFAFAERQQSGIWTIDPILHHAIDERLYRFIVELQVGVHISLQRDVMGQSFRPSEINLAYPPARDFRLTEELVGCSLRFGQPANEIVFDATWLDQTANLGNRTTYRAVVALCDELLTGVALRSGVAGKVRTALLIDIANHPTLIAIAKRLGTTTRTLRRQLEQQGTSFRELIDELRTQIAVKYLRETVMTNEDIATALGFSDAANLRHAFRRWTGKTPSEFRLEASPRVAAGG
jgi:AraC-like DNA-binding protein